ncbi:putative cyclin-dependent kinase F-2 [Oryza brachyantha]|nr:putative cyclin-dependent kinase F-2 [Oryza brachyantha]
MNEAGFMHRDIKPDNVLVDEHGNVKICDLGFARTKAGSPPPFSNPVAALLYRAPEVLLESTTYDETVDTWALGCLMALLLAGNPLFYGKTEVEMLRAILDVLGMDDLTRWRGYANCMIKKSKMRFVRRDSRLREMFPIPGMIGGGGRRPELSPAGFEVLKGLLSCNPERRMTAAEALEQRWFES